MKIIATHEEKIPSYALAYICDDDLTGLSKQDKIIIDNYMKEFHDFADTTGSMLQVSPCAEEPYFSNLPAFGLPCEVIDTKITFLKGQ